MTATRPTFAPARLLFTACVALLFPFWASAADKLPPNYPFPKPPLRLLAELEKADVGMPGGPTADERKLLAKVWEQKGTTGGGPVTLTDAELIDLLLFADGVTDPVARVKFRMQLARLREVCGADLTGAEKPADRGEKLFAAVYRTLPKGYELNQTRVSEALDTGRFNCVSVSAVLLLAGAQHGFDFRPMRTTGHAYLEWMPTDGGKRAVVEGTNPAGFRYVEKMTAFDRWLCRTDLERYARGRELDRPGLAGCIYYNRGNDRLNAGDCPTAARLYLSALVTDPADPESGINLLVALDTWGVSLLQAGKYAEASRVLGTAASFTPRTDAERQALASVWWNYVLTAVGQEDAAEAGERVRRAGECLPAAAQFDSPAAFYARLAFVLGGRNLWELGAGVFDRGLTGGSAEQRKWLRGQRAEYYRQWSAALVEAGDLTASLQVLTEASRLAPYHPATRAAVRHHAAAAARHPLAATHTARLRDVFPEAAGDGWVVERSGDTLVRSR